MTTQLDTRTLEERIVSKWTNQQVGQALEVVLAVGATNWTPAMKAAVKAEAARRLQAL